MQTSKPLRLFAVLALIIAIMACASRRTASDELRSTATTTADAIATQAHAAVRTDTATAHTVSRDTTRQQTTTADTTAAHYRRATWQQADTTFTEIWINARRFRYHDGSTASHKETRAATSTAIDTDSCRLISHTDTISAVQKKHEETDRRPLDRAVLGYSVYTFFVLIVVLLVLLYLIGRLKK